MYRDNQSKFKLNRKVSKGLTGGGEKLPYFSMSTDFVFKSDSCVLRKDRIRLTYLWCYRL